MRPTPEPAADFWANTIQSRAANRAQYPRQPFHRPRTSLGAPGHLIHLAMVAAPVFIGEFIKDSDKRWRAMRLIPVLGGIASELVWTQRLMRDRQKDEETRAALRSCAERG